MIGTYEKNLGPKQGPSSPSPRALRPKEHGLGEHLQPRAANACAALMRRTITDMRTIIIFVVLVLEVVAVVV